MKGINVILTAALTFVAGMSASAQTGAATGTRYGKGDDSVRCVQNISLFTSYYKGNDFKSAAKFWKDAYAECPASTKNIYIYGINMIKMQLQQEKDPKKRQELLDKLMKLYDDRAKYFGDDPKYGLDFIATNRIADYMSLVPQDKYDYTKIYDWCKPAIEAYKGDANPQTIYYFVFASLNKAIKDKNWHEQYIKDFMFGNDALDKQIEQAGDDSAHIKLISSLKDPMDDLFARSGLADCNMMEKIYGPKLEENKDNVDFLSGMLTMMRMTGCETSQTYTKGSRYLFNIKPTAEAAMGLAKEALDQRRTSEAIQLLQQAISLAKSAKMRASCNYTIGVINMNSHNYGAAKGYFNKAIQEDPSMGEAMLCIGQMIASSASSFFPDDKLKQRCVYWLAIEKLQRAKSMDPGIAGKANSLIATYSKYLPSAADIFMHPDLDKGKSLFVGGWVGESVTIR
ncbi:tetratricopeptide repeat protein [Falsiporphyromonas endometrii]|uniref:Tetratricopeptide repeat protein n=1 Tax=Falsiporphyromonas endometrii TaxID=1387297 RepID=A0ABV9K826_9PORP